MNEGRIQFVYDENGDWTGEVRLAGPRLRRGLGWVDVERWLITAGLALALFLAAIFDALVIYVALKGWM